ncbi:TauD/TfdA dioxygenase family protein [Nocardia blacklockiae]|uniref:TauD/TfdA dioxygenase family protein n=1 Tax=Nocardia blacklockiae TaxID=480036 RepID=UPI0018960E8F|nr:TauD/TfdA family dioxygenase [Nocardia blacklockiae]MBF6171870.1 TauD/TfdA family dioxygenase [Nocardia blacklockiae]
MTTVAAQAVPAETTIAVQPLSGYTGAEISGVDLAGELSDAVIADIRRALLKCWHTDATALINPPSFSILRADILPPYGGDTAWTNLVAAYENLPAPVREFADTLDAEYTVRFRWQPGSVAFWDNRATAHLAIPDAGHLGHDRVLYRVTLEGDVPQGVDGRRSESVEGEPFYGS